MTNYTKGRRYEYKSMRVLEAAGYECSRTAGSHGVWDVIGFSVGGVALVQVKFNCNITPAEEEQFRLYPCPENCIKLVHLWARRGRIPLVRVIE